MSLSEDDEVEKFDIPSFEVRYNELPQEILQKVASGKLW